jgi:hypothetical protein
MAGYDRGRGAYYAKFLLRPECRRVIAMGWLKEVRNHLDGKHLVRLSRELRSAGEYLLSHRRIVPLATLVVAGLAVYGTAAVAVAARAMLKPKPRNAAVQP